MLETREGFSPLETCTLSFRGYIKNIIYRWRFLPTSSLFWGRDPESARERVKERERERARVKSSLVASSCAVASQELPVNINWEMGSFPAKVQSEEVKESPSPCKFLHSFFNIFEFPTIETEISRWELWKKSSKVLAGRTKSWKPS